jgi:hypothetical protein
VYADLHVASQIGVYTDICNGNVFGGGGGLEGC